MDTGSYQGLVASHLPLGGQVGCVQEQQIICPIFSFRVPPILHPPHRKWALGVEVALQPLGIWDSAGAQVWARPTKANLVSVYWVYLKWDHPLSPSARLALLAHQIWPQALQDPQDSPALSFPCQGLTH